MTGVLKLPAKIDLTATDQLVSDLRALEGDIAIDASEVTHLGTLGLQALIAASRSAHAAGHAFSFTSVTDRMKEQMQVMGTSPEKLMEGAQ